MLAAELQAPVGYDGRWLLLMLASLLVVVAYYTAVLRWGRPRPARSDPRGRRAACLARLDEIERATAAGQIDHREGHRRVSETVREFVADATGLPARSMTLADLRREGPPHLAEVIALVYPPEFAPGEELPRTRLAPVLARARELVTTWT